MSFPSIILGAVTSLFSVCPQGCDFSQIQQALQAAHSGDTIQIREGVYHETLPILIDKEVYLKGEGQTVVVGDGTHDIFVIRANNVEIAGLEVRDTGSSYLHELAGVRVEDASACYLHDLRSRKNAFGIYLANSQNCRIENNQIEGDAATQSDSGNGIHSWYGKGHLVKKNQISGHRDGIYLEFTTDTFVSENLVEGNARYGLHFMTSHRNEYAKNTFQNNGAGVAVMYSREVRMHDNRFAENQGSAAYGLLLKDISKGEIRNNTFEQNTFGIYMEGTNHSRFQSNTFQDNGYGLKIFADCDDNDFNGNNFVGNTFDVVTNSSRNPNRFAGNFWSHYQGYDLNNDGLGDVPYHLVSLSSVLVEKFDSTYLLINSPLFLLLDTIEQAFPLLVPESLRDETPLVEPVSFGGGSL